MTKIAFFNPYHNGDLYHSKEFVRQVISVVGNENVIYFHNKDPKVIADLGIINGRINGLNYKFNYWFWQEKDLFLINTWVCAYYDLFPDQGACTLKFNMLMWKEIYAKINEILNTNLELGPIENYVPYVDYTKYDINAVEDFIQDNRETKLLFCNGPALSGQSKYNGDMRKIIVDNAQKHPDKLFITTHKIRSDLTNIIHTSDITKNEVCDLPEIAYLSRTCSLIVGRNSGPFCFASNRETLNDPTKTFYAFGSKCEDCFTWGIPLKSNYVFEKFENYETLHNSLSTIIDHL